jgi:CheY-like chemotaxis protein
VLNNPCWALVVEGDAHSLIAIGAILRDLGIDFKRNTTGVDVIDKLAMMRPRPDFILLDLDLPHGDAFEIIQSLKSHRPFAAIPVIAIADEIRPSILVDLQKTGFAGFINKPLPRRQFGQLLEQVLAGQPVWQMMA